jgi:dolichol-phosphate mannosyltransferase
MPESPSASPLPVEVSTSAWPRTLVVPFVYNEGEKIRSVLKRIPHERPYTVLVMDDGSTDGATEGIEDEFNCLVLRHEHNTGVGRAFRTAFEWFLAHDYEVFVPMAGNNKDEPLEIPRLVAPLIAGEADLVQGSRFLPGGGYGNMPFYRRLATRLHPWLFSLAVGKRITESTNGFRAIHRRILEDPRLDWRQEWLGQYELEPYLLYKAINLGYRHLEVPCTKIYPNKDLGQTKMKALVGWWSILRPLIWLRLGLKK